MICTLQHAKRRHDQKVEQLGISTTSLGGRLLLKSAERSSDISILSMPDVQSAMPCELGVTRLFGEGDIGETGLLAGWSYPEQGHVWNDGPESVLELLVRKPRSVCRLTFEGEPFLHTRHPRQDLVLHVNGFRVGFWRLQEARSYVLFAEVQPEQMFERRGGSLLRCVWHLPLSLSPARLDLGDDSRELGFCFRSFSLEETA